ncbi:PH, RCC1 and FYVE domains-containing protein 1 [Balamuthia mandrillaris]
MESSARADWWSFVREGRLKQLQKANLQVKDLNKRNHSGQTLLHHAVLHNQPATLAYLLSLASASWTSEQLDLEVREDKNGWTPLHCAVGLRNLPCVVLLVKAGALLDAPDKKNETPLDMICASLPSVTEGTHCPPPIGEIYTWGEGSNYSLGHGDPYFRERPKRIKRLEGVDIVQLSTSHYSTACVTRSGALYTFGFGKGGRLGHGDDESCLLPKRLCGPLRKKKVTKVSVGELHTALLTDEGHLFTFGQGNYGQLGHGNMESLKQPRRVRGSLDKHYCVEVSAGGHHTIVLTSGRELFSFGRGDSGQLGYLVDLDVLSSSGNSTNPTTRSSNMQGQSTIPACSPPLSYTIINKSSSSPATRTVAVRSSTADHPVAPSSSWSSSSSLLSEPSSGDQSWGGSSGFLLAETFTEGADNRIHYCQLTPRLIVCIDASIVEASAGGLHTACLTNEGEVFIFGFGSPHPRRISFPSQQARPRSRSSINHPTSAYMPTSTFYSELSPNGMTTTSSLSSAQVSSPIPASSSYYSINDDFVDPHYVYASPVSTSSATALSTTATINVSGDATLCVFGKQDLFLVAPKDIFNNKRSSTGGSAGSLSSSRQKHKAQKLKVIRLPCLPGKKFVTKAALNANHEVFAISEPDGHLWKHIHKYVAPAMGIKESSLSSPWQRISFKPTRSIACSSTHYAAIISRNAVPLKVNVTPSTLASDFIKQLNNKEFSDVILTLADKNRYLYAHKLILASRCTYFAKLFADLNKSISEQKQPHVYVQEPQNSSGTSIDHADSTLVKFKNLAHNEDKDVVVITAGLDDSSHLSYPALCKFLSYLYTGSLENLHETTVGGAYTEGPNTDEERQEILRLSRLFQLRDRDHLFDLLRQRSLQKKLPKPASESGPKKPNDQLRNSRQRDRLARKGNSRKQRRRAKTLFDPQIEEAKEWEEALRVAAELDTADEVQNNDNAEEEKEPTKEKEQRQTYDNQQETEEKERAFNFLQYGMWRMYNDFENCTEVDIVLGNETDDGQGNDCTTDKAVSFHKVVLMARSEVFQAMFASGMVEAQRKRIVLPNAQHLLTLKKLKEFFYLGQVNFLSPLPSPPFSSSSLSSAGTPSGSNGALSHQDDLIESREADQDKQNANLFLDLDVIMELIELSNEFILERLKQLCEEFIVTTQHALFENHLVDLLIAADTYRCDQLKRNCLDYIRSNLVDLLMSNSLHPLCSDFDGKYSHLLTEAERHTWNSCAPSVSFHHNLLSTPASVIPSQRNLASTEEKHDQRGLEPEEDTLCNQEGKLRRIRTLRKKLLQIQKLEQRRAKGEHLDEYQEAKIIQSFALKDELSLLCAAVSNVSGIEELSPLKPSSTSLSTTSTDASFSTDSTKETTKTEVIPSSEAQSSDNPLDTVPQAAPLDRKISNCGSSFTPKSKSPATKNPWLVGRDERNHEKRVNDQTRCPPSTAHRKNSPLLLGLSQNLHQQANSCLTSQLNTSCPLLLGTLFPFCRFSKKKGGCRQSQRRAFVRLNQWPGAVKRARLERIQPRRLLPGLPCR